MSSTVSTLDDFERFVFVMTVLEGYSEHARLRTLAMRASRRLNNSQKRKGIYDAQTNSTPA